MSKPANYPTAKERADATAERVVESFRSGRLPAALAPIFIHRNDPNVPCRKWSWLNQLLAALSGTADARGFRQWEEVGRSVKKGEKAFYILVPCTRKVEVENDRGEKEERVAVYGFKAAAVFGVEQTEGDDVPETDPAVRELINSLPLIDVAREWGIHVDAYNGAAGKPLGKYQYAGDGERKAIVLGVENAATWAHELCHAADHRNVGKLKSGQDLDQEVVAELGSAVLLNVLGLEAAADVGGAWRYIEHYCTANEVEPIAVCQRLLNRTCEAVALILATAEQLAGQREVELQEVAA